MEYPKYSFSIGRYLALTTTVSILTCSLAHAESVATINGVEIDSTTYEFYLENRLQKSLSQATAEEKSAVLDELKDIYTLTTQPRAKEMSENPRLKAQIELQYRAALAQAVAGDWLASHPASEEEIQAEYDAQALLAPALQFKARHILVETQGAAAGLIAQLDSGASFEELAKANSTGPSGPSGGELGWFSPEDMVAPFSNAVSALEDGAYTKAPVQTEFGWHIILREESRASVPPPLESVRDSVKSNVEQSNFQNYLESLRDGAEE
jgi:peptidyl-prolyl cis-trans isomerase C